MTYHENLKESFCQHEKIGAVDFYASQESIDDGRYSDGDIEDKMLSFFQTQPSKNDIDTVLHNNPTWAEEYHYTPVRHNLLSWYDFDTQASLLEVGSGAGALTGLFCDRVDSVTAAELTFRRSQITAHRHQKKNNLTVIAGNIHDLPGDETFDYVTSIGVLEYAGVFAQTKDPFVAFLRTLYNRLNKGGTLIIAIENRFGLKYWAGCREDHTNILFDSLEGYPAQNQKKTFGKKEITQLINRAGFSAMDFHYPLPDYKLPTEIFSDDHLPTEKHLPRSSHYPSHDYTSHAEEQLFKEQLVIEGIIKNDQFDFFANSFLIFAHKK